MLWTHGGEWEYDAECGCERCETWRIRQSQGAPSDKTVCSRCHGNVSFHWDEYEKDWVSDCCTAYAVAPESPEPF